MSNENSRGFPRIAKEVSIETQELSYPMRQEYESIGTTKNIAANGVCFHSSVGYDVDAVVAMKLYLRGMSRYIKTVYSIVDNSQVEKPLSVLAKVVWCNDRPSDGGYEIGAEFVDVCEDDHEVLKKLLQYQQ